MYTEVYVLKLFAGQLMVFTILYLMIVTTVTIQVMQVLMMFKMTIILIWKWWKGPQVNYLKLLMHLVQCSRRKRQGTENIAWRLKGSKEGYKPLCWFPATICTDTTFGTYTGADQWCYTMVVTLRAWFYCSKNLYVKSDLFVLDLDIDEIATVSSLWRKSPKSQSILYRRW